MNMKAYKLLAQKRIKKGDRVITLKKKGYPIAVAVEDFIEGDVGIIDFDFSYPVKYKSNLLMLPGLKKVKVKKKKKKIIVKRRKKNAGRRPTSKKNKRTD